MELENFIRVGGGIHVSATVRLWWTSLAVLSVLFTLFFLSSISVAAGKSTQIDSPTRKAAVSIKKMRGVALVIGGGVLGDKLVLQSASLSACLVADDLRRSGLNVTEVQDAGRLELSSAIKDFKKKAQNSDIAFVYFAGFTIAYRGGNRLVPIDVDFSTSKRMQRSTIAVSELIAVLKTAQHYGLLVLDGGYKHPKLKRLQRRRRSRVSKGFARMSKSKNLAFLLADRPARWRSGSTDQVSKLSKALSKWLSRPTENVSKALQHIVEDVRAASARKQHPLLVDRLQNSSRWPFNMTAQDEDDSISFQWEDEENDSRDEIAKKCLKLAKIRVVQRKKQQVCKRVLKKAKLEGYQKLLQNYPDAFCSVEVRRRRDSILENKRWKRISQKENIEEFKSYLERFPGAKHSGEAKRRISKLIAIREKEKHLWSKVIGTDTIRAYREFLLDHSGGIYAKEAEKRLVALKKEEKKRIEKIACVQAFGDEVLNVELSKNNGYICEVHKKGKRSRLIPISAKLDKDWLFSQSKKRMCKIWTYPVSVSGTLDSRYEPRSQFWRSRNWLGGSIGVGFTQSRHWDRSKSISVDIGGTTYSLRFTKGWVEPLASNMGKILKALRKAYQFSVQGTSSSGERLELTFSARGYVIQMRRMASKCGRRIMSWIEEWGGVTRKGTGNWFQWGSGYSSEIAVKKSLLKYCRKLGKGSCRVAKTFENSCFALYKSMSGGSTISTARTVGDAKQNARERCELNREGCYLSAAECSDGSDRYKNTNPPSPSLTWRIKSDYPYSVLLGFYSQKRKRAWPGGGQAYVLKDSEVHEFSLSCRWGESICYGAWPKGLPNSSWGCGYRCKQGCSNCCYPCKGQPTEVHTLNP